MKAKNLKEFKALIKRYESITLEEIKEADVSLPNTTDVIRIVLFQVSGVYKQKANKLTGFGDNSTCTLCILPNLGSSDCDGCVYLDMTEDKCNKGINLKTYIRICEANSPTKLRNAFRARAKHMQTLLK